MEDRKNKMPGSCCQKPSDNKNNCCKQPQKQPENKQQNPKDQKQPVKPPIGK